MAQRRLGQGDSTLASTYERLSSGLRINKASDDAAGLSIADSLSIASRVAQKGVSNLNDGISALNIADGAVESVQNILVRLKELSIQASNGTLSNKQRRAIDSEAQLLVKEHDRIIKTTEFNGQSVFSQSNAFMSLEAGGSELVTALGSNVVVGNGTYVAKPYGEATSNVDGLIVNDFNKDGLLDIAGVGPAADGYLNLMFGNGDGSFYQPVTMYLGAGASRPLAADFDNDGNLDIVARDALDGFHVALSNADGSFKAPSHLTTSAGTACDSLVLGDFNSDGNVDITWMSNSITYVFTGNGNGTFSAKASATLSHRISGGAAGDINNDGVLDILGGWAGNVYYALGRGDGTFVSGTLGNIVGNALGRSQLRDINGDGNLDFAIADQNTESNVYLGNGDATFKAAIKVATITAAVNTPAFSDMDGDGKLDLLITDINTRSFLVFHGNGDGSFDTYHSNRVANFNLGNSIYAGDVNNDGIPDILGAGATGFHVLLGNGTTSTVSLGQRLLYYRGIDLSSLYSARKSQAVISDQMTFVSAIRGSLGASQSRAQAAVSVLSNSALNYQSAESRIRDADLAYESSEALSSNIIRQAAVSVLAQANMQPQLALKLLSA